jgi:TrmH family RNA methyltransferase
VTGQYLGCADTLQKSGYKIIATDLRGEDSTEVLKQAKFILALGNEAAGLSDELLSLSDYKLRIPMTAEKAESLNVAVAGGILMYLSGREI